MAQASQPHEHLTQVSRTERQTFWEATPAEECMQHWRSAMQTFLTPYLTDPAKHAELVFLQTLLKGGEEPASAVEVSAEAIYATFMAGEGQGDVGFFVGRILARASREEIARHSAIIHALAKIYGEAAGRLAVIRMQQALEQMEAKAEGGHSLLLGTCLETGEAVCLSRTARLHGVTCLGTTGTGKSTLALNAILTSIQQADVSVCVIEPHNSLINAVIAAMPEERLKDVILVDLSEASAASIGLNLYECADPGNPAEVAKTLSFVMHLFAKVWGADTTTAPQLTQVLRNTSLALIQAGLTFAELPMLLWEEDVRERLTTPLTSPQSRAFWQQYEALSARDRASYVASTINKCDAYLHTPLLANILSQERSTLDLREIIDSKKILLVSLTPMLEELSNLLGALLVGKILMSAFSRLTDSLIDSAAERPDCHLYIDEFGRFVSQDSATLIHEARKTGLATWLANQVLDQLDSANRAAALGAGTLMAFRVSGPDSAVLATAYDHTPPLEQVGLEPVRSPCTNVFEHLVRRGHSNGIVATFTSEYLLALQSLLEKLGTFEHPFPFGCTLVTRGHLIEGQRLINEVLVGCMRTGAASGFIYPLALLTVGGAADARITRVFQSHIRSSVSDGYVLAGFYQSGNAFGRPGFRTEQALSRFLASYTRPGVLGRLLHVTPRIPEGVTAFVRFLRSLRAVMEVLAREPVLVDTGQYTPIMRPRSYADVAAECANMLATQPNFQARVKTLGGEYTIRPSSPPPQVSASELAARRAWIKRRNLAVGYYTRHSAVSRAS